jgi:hypothetical protein
MDKRIDGFDILVTGTGAKFSMAVLKDLLPDTESTLFFGKLYRLSVGQLGRVLRTLFEGTTVIDALLAEDGLHSHELQDYIVDELGFEDLVSGGQISMEESVPPPAQLLPELWEAAEIEIARSIQEVADRLQTVVAALPGKKGRLLLKSMQVMNAKRPVLGDYRASIHHPPREQNLVVLDVSGSMSEDTVRRIVGDVVGLAYLADAHLAVVSDTTTRWGPGEFDVDQVLAASEFSGTHYETLAPLLDERWGVVVTIADYDSSIGAAELLKERSGRIGMLLDISLVSRPTFLAEALSPLADEVRPLLMAADGVYQIQ